MKKAMLAVGVLIAVPLLYVGGNLLYSTVNDFSPPEVEDVAVQNAQIAIPDSTISLLIWNIGYGGLGQESDFFYDGGTTVRMSYELTEKNLSGIEATLAGLDTVDIVLLQEVDTLAKRSWWFNEYDRLRKVFPNHSAAFTLNY
jgi:hypothetical protein